MMPRAQTAPFNSAPPVTTATPPLVCITGSSPGHGCAGSTWEDSRMHQSTDPRYIQAPKVLLHDHLDGGLRPQTVLDICAEIGHELPAQSADDLDRWFRDSADSGSLERY